MIIAIDFDGVIYDGIDEIPQAIEYIKKLKNDGHKIILWTCRAESRLHGVVQWCIARDIEPDAVNACVVDSEWFSHPKVHADIYIDDKSYPPFTPSMWEALYLKVVEYGV